MRSWPARYGVTYTGGSYTGVTSPRIRSVYVTCTRAGYDGWYITRSAPHNLFSITLEWEQLPESESAGSKVCYGKPGHRLSQISFPEAWQLSASSNWATHKTGPTFNIKPSLSPTCKGNSWRMWAQSGQEDTPATHLFCPKTHFCSLLGRIWRGLNHDGGEGGWGAAGERAGEGSGEGGVPHRLLLLVVLETRLDLAGGPLLHLRVSVWIWKERGLKWNCRKAFWKRNVLCYRPWGSSVWIL